MNNIIQIDPGRPEDEKIEKAVSLLRNGKIVAFPTDTVYGLGVNAEDTLAVDKLYKIKKRAKSKPFVLFLARKESFIYFAEVILLSAQKLVNKFWPGPLTLLFKANKAAPANLVSKEGKIGMRFPDHPIPNSITEKGGLLLATTSANFSGAVSPSIPQQLSKALANNIDLVLEGGEALIGKESSVVDVTHLPPRLLREGSLSSQEIEQAWKKESNILFVCSGNICRSPMAEGLAKRLWQGRIRESMKIHSAGTTTLPGFKAAPLGIKMMKKRGIDIGLHRSTPLTTKGVDEADLILVMEQEHRRQILRTSPSAEGKVFLLKHFALGIEEDIGDPMGGSPQDYQGCAQQIEETIQGLIWKLSNT